MGYSGPSREATAAQSPLDFFKLFVDEAALVKVCEETNRYAAQISARDYKNVSIEEIMAFIALNIAMGIINMSDMKDYWSTDPILSHSWFPTIMSRDRFLQILQCLHLVNNSEDTGNDKLFKVRPFLNQIVRQCKRHYQPKREISIDEQMIGTKCRVSFRQYMPMKPNKSWHQGLGNGR